MSNLYSIGLMNQLGDALEAAKYTPDEVTKLRVYSNLNDFKGVLTGCSKIVVVQYIIDCDADPFVPSGFTLMSHRKGGQIVWDPTKFQLYLSERQRSGKIIAGKGLGRELADVSGILNANVLDYFLAHQEIIPPECEGVVTYFWGTKFLSGGSSYVRCLYRGGGRWSSDYAWLGDDWDDASPAARFAS
ncbi:MAG: hypothetical protein A2626_02170 [Candidatus Nealsonbacteria bacterium RIFCSPHIGHO2_01_FULL_38_55]|uniref:Uncharacterized protein n=1 Tax=Candidatus Nealsonbacteria bacterium RIFCSPHIGHO2_01_FULL_38_55 TaxID=1801664 RepID=A0A1G2E0X1_9BACT|nr:MAG: hypothetical protein A2626_02170 [Candidatus Nealsonbacteria bacterium RIFCSPHIGHO2_01_FULL_38_55]OGZ21561.1 MAG: hypothetical protein A3C48_01895 [Candidatus Nealsonbacteria bacterium RIFCSPHIGHO2_02_FULL_38_75]OGZ26491.1 MAG: hypothetical protein A3I85_03220 [Candidatus Nealsonbacteria bacterium RIFCSPLOWO2_02_FULL_38_63]